VAETGTVAILEWQPPDRLVRLSPPIGAGAFPESAYHVQLDVFGTPPRAVALGERPEASFFVWTPPGQSYPFDMRRRALTGLPTPRSGAAVAPLGDGLWLVAGGIIGGLTGGTPSNVLEVYAPAIGRGFRLGPDAVLASPRAFGYATILSGRRIVVAGGRAAGGALVPTPQVFTF
jgi:hypothetical protein